MKSFQGIPSSPLKIKMILTIQRNGAAILERRRAGADLGKVLGGMGRGGGIHVISVPIEAREAR